MTTGGSGGFFLSKKQKKLMQARRKKKKQHDQHQQQHQQQQQEATTTDTADDQRPSKRQCTESTRSQQSLEPSGVTNAAASSSSSSSSITPATPASAAAPIQNGNKKDDDEEGDTIRKVVIPSDSTAKEAKKLRKEARRKARSEGWPEDKIVFVDERQRPLPGSQEHAVEEENDHHASTEEASRAAATTKQHPDNSRNKKRKVVFPRINDILKEEAKKAEQQARIEARQATEDALPDEIKNRYVALDCEMVGTGVDGKISVLARVSLVDWSGNVLLDTYVQVPTRVTDFRTQWSGITASKIQSHTGAMAVDACRKRVAALIKGKILVGHALKNDLDALILTHPKEDIRDTAKYRFYQRLWNNKWRPRKLRDLVLEHCGIVIQQQDNEDGGGGTGHDSIEDARASMELFKVAREAWEKELEQKKQKRARKR